MSQAPKNPPKPNVTEDEVREKFAEETYDPRDLAMKPGYTEEKDPEEVVTNPAVTPEMLNEARDSNTRRDLRRN